MNTYTSELTLDNLDTILASSESTYCYSSCDMYGLQEEPDCIEIIPSDYNTRHIKIYAIGWTVMKDTWDKLMLKRKEEK